MASKALRDGGIQWTRNKGRNGWDVPSDIPPDMSAESINVEIVKDSLGRRRNGSNTQAFTGDAHGAAMVLARFSPAQDDSAAELHFITNDATTKVMRVAAGTVAAALTIDDTILPADAHKATWAVLNGKLYWAYNGSFNRLHVYDPNISTTVLRRAGLAAATAAPTMANTGAGSYAATIRYYRVRFQVFVASTLQRESEASPSDDFTPSGAGTAARVTRPTAPGEGETHWTVEGSADGTNFFVLAAPIAIATTTYDDSAAVSSYASLTAAPLTGTRLPFPSVKYIVAGEDRLLGFGVYETAAGSSVLPRAGRVYYTPVLDSSDQDDDERIDFGVTNPGYIDVGRNRGYEDRALAGPVDGQYFVFQSKGTYMLVPTGELDVPFRRITLSGIIGAVSHITTFVGEDESGKPCVYWLDPVRGPYRYGRNGLQWCGYDVQDIWATFNAAATTSTGFGYWDPIRRAAVWHIATGANNSASRRIVFHAREGQATEVEGVRYGWIEDTSSKWFAGTSWSAVLFPTTFGATMSRVESPYIATSVALYRLDVASAQDDDGSTFQAYVTSPAYELAPKHVNKQIGSAYMQASAHAGVTLRQTLTRNFGDHTAITRDVSIAPTGAQTRVLVKFDELSLTDAYAIQVRLGDAAAIAAPAWTIDEWLATVEQGDER